MAGKFAELLLRLWLAVQFRRPAEPTPEDFQRELWRTDARRMGVRPTERLRDRLRRTWLRLVNREPEA